MAQGSRLTLFILEPFGKNTARHMFCLPFCDENEIVLVTPSDHLIKNSKDIRKKLALPLKWRVRKACYLWHKPTIPEAGYGYIESAKK